MKKLLASFVILVFISCTSHQEKKPSTVISTDTTATLNKQISQSIISNKKDPICNMPTKAGIEDTALYKGKIIGFCSQSCKDEFLKQPKKYSIQ